MQSRQPQPLQLVQKQHLDLPRAAAKNSKKEDALEDGKSTASVDQSGKGKGAAVVTALAIAPEAGGPRSGRSKARNVGRAAASSCVPTSQRPGSSGAPPADAAPQGWVETCSIGRFLSPN